ncbi:hypothetical protein SESBI_32154 [Sesbania bispinosa]|nr:hypothetical protein SESBI_32154 [Sesbania bispinosa]
MDGDEREVTVTAGSDVVVMNDAGSAVTDGGGNGAMPPNGCSVARRVVGREGARSCYLPRVLETAPPLSKSIGLLPS